MDAGEWLQQPILLLESHSLQELRMVLWSGQLDHADMLLVARTEDGDMIEPLSFHRSV